MLAVLEVMLVDREMIKRLIASIYVSALIPVGYTIFKVVTHHSQFTSGGFSRFEGTFSQPNPFAIYLTMLIVMGAALFPHLTQKKKIGMARPAVLLDRLPLLHVHAQCVDRMRRSGCSRSRSWGAGGSCSGSWSAASWCRWSRSRRSPGVSPTSASRPAPRATHRTRSSWRFSYWGDVLPLADQGPDHRHRPEHELATRPASRRNRTTTSCVRTWRPASSERSPISRCSSAWCWWRDTRCDSPNGDRGPMNDLSRWDSPSCVIAFVVISVVSNVITEVIVLWYYVAFAAAAYAVTRYRENAELRRPAAARRGTRSGSGGRVAARRVRSHAANLLRQHQVRILHVNKFLYRRGGAEAYMEDLADLQVAAGHTVAVLRHGASAQHAPRVRVALSRAHRARAATADADRARARRGAHALLDVGEQGHGRGARRVPPGRRAHAQHLPPALAVGAASGRAAQDSRR